MPFVRGVERYSAFLYPDGRNYEGRVNLYCADGHRLYVVFRRAGEPLGTNTYNARTKVGVAYEAIDGYERYVDMLRNERPIWATFNPDSTPPSFVVYCNREPVGEEEMMAA